MRRFLSVITALLIGALLNASPYQFVKINTENSDLSYDGISKIYQDSRDFIWIRTFKGLNRYCPSTEELIQKPRL